MTKIKFSLENWKNNFIKNLNKCSSLSPKKYTDLGIVGKKEVSSTGKIIRRKSALKQFKVQYAKSGFEFDDKDTKDKYWYPQGISYIKESKKNKTIVVSWYSKKNGYARITFVKPIGDKVEYNHVTLVQRDGASTYKGIKTHAGGVAIIGNYIYVADSNLKGIRIFDANILFEVSEPNSKKCGIINGKSCALGNRYIIPEICYYNVLVGPSSMSYMSVDRSNPKEPRLLTGNFTSTVKSKYDNGSSLVALWKMEKDKSGIWLIDSNDGTISVKTKRAQGAVKFKDNFMINRSYSSSTHSIRIGTIQNKKFKYKKPKTSNWPVGCEDLSYDNDQSELWGVTEFPNGKNNGYRFVYCADWDKLIKNK